MNLRSRVLAGGIVAIATMMSAGTVALADGPGYSYAVDPNNGQPVYNWACVSAGVEEQGQSVSVIFAGPVAINSSLWDGPAPYGTGGYCQWWQSHQ